MNTEPQFDDDVMKATKATRHSRAVAGIPDRAVVDLADGHSNNKQSDAAYVVWKESAGIMTGDRAMLPLQGQQRGSQLVQGNISAIGRGEGAQFRGPAEGGRHLKCFLRGMSWQLWQRRDYTSSAKWQLLLAYRNLILIGGGLINARRT